MDYDEFKRRLEEEKRKGFEVFQKSFNEAMRKQGRSDTLDSIMGRVLGGGLPKPSDPALAMQPFDAERSEQLAELFLDIHKETTDEDPRDVVLRALACYRSFIKHARAGGQVKFVREGAPERVLKVRLR